MTRTLAALLAAAILAASLMGGELARPGRREEELEAITLTDRS